MDETSNKTATECGPYEAELKIREPLSDEAFLATLGYKQELRREFTPIELFGVGFSIIGIFPSIRRVYPSFPSQFSLTDRVSSVLFFSLPYGAVGMVWGVLNIAILISSQFI